MTQKDVATGACISVPTIRLLEQGRGYYTSFITVCERYGLHVVGQHLPQGNCIGKQLQLLRKARGYSQASLASMTWLSRRTIVSLEQGSSWLLRHIDILLMALASGARIISAEEKPNFYTGAGNSSINHAWTTPKRVLEALYSVVSFDIDPCSPCRWVEAPVKPKLHYTKNDDGLAMPWRWNVYMNPPYGAAIKLWIAKAYTEVMQGKAYMVIALVPARTDTQRWHNYVVDKATTYFFKGRLAFGDVKQTAPFPSVLVVWGGSERVLEKIAEALPMTWRR